MKQFILLIFMATALCGSCFGKAKNDMENKEHYTFDQSGKVTRQKIKFNNRYGITLVADLYIPKEQLGNKLAAIAVSGPFGAVKEQSSGLYAQAMAERGFLTIAFDPSYTGESGGEPRYVASPDINTEDFSAAVDYLLTRDDVDTKRIGIIGICGWGGLALNAAAIDTRIKATVTVTMYDMSRVNANGYFDSMDAEARYELRTKLNAQRTIDAKNGSYALGGGVIDPLPEDAPKFVKDYHDYYKTDRGCHKRSLNSNNGWNITSSLSFINMPLLAYSDEIRSAVLMIHGEKAHSRYFSEDAFKRLKGNNKELLIIPGASHVDLYDNKAGVIPYDKMVSFFAENLTNNQQTNINMKEKTEPVLGLGDIVTENFTGEAWLRMLSAQPETYDCTIYNVTFAPSTRNYWHAHSDGQILICTEGVGCFQEKDKPAQQLKPGMVVHIPAGVVHWHGAMPDSRFTHIGITPKASQNKVEWIGEVTDKEYIQATNSIKID